MSDNQQVMKLALTLAFKWEAHNGINNSGFRAALGEAMAHKYWQGIRERGDPKGGYWWLGGRESMNCRLQAHYGVAVGGCQQEVGALEPFDQRTDTAKDVKYMLAYAAAADVFGKYSTQAGANYRTRPYDWGNPSPSFHPELVGRNRGVCPGQVYYIYPEGNTVQTNNDCILTFDQLDCLTKPETKPYCQTSCQAYKRSRGLP